MARLHWIKPVLFFLINSFYASDFEHTKTVTLSLGKSFSPGVTHAAFL